MNVYHLKKTADISSIHLNSVDLVIVVEDDAQLVMTPEMFAYDEPLQPLRIQYQLGKRAHVSVRQHIPALSFVNLQIQLDENAFFEYQAILASKIGSVNIMINCIGRQSTASVMVVTVLGENNHMQVRSRQEHHAANSTSSFTLKGLALADAHLNYEGTVFIPKDVINADANQQSSCLIDGLEAQVETKPILEVMHHQVRCAHGSAIGHIDQEQIIYAAMRGIDDAKARIMLAQGFLTDMLDLSLQPLVHTMIQQQWL